MCLLKETFNVSKFGRFDIFENILILFLQKFSFSRFCKLQIASGILSILFLDKSRNFRFIKSPIVDGIVFILFLYNSNFYYNMHQ
jgi:hypothetical protein